MVPSQTASLSEGLSSHLQFSVLEDKAANCSSLLPVTFTDLCEGDSHSYPY